MKVYLNNKITNGDNNSTPDYEITLPKYIDWIHVADMNGDGIDEMIVQQYYLSTKLIVYEFSNGSGFSEAASFVFLHKNIVKTGDFLGNGTVSCMVLQLSDSETVSGGAYVLRYDKQTGEYVSENLSECITCKKCNVLADDFTGDGRMDIMIVGENKGYVYSTIQTNNGWSLQKIIDFSSNLASLWIDKTAYSGDFNADGKADIIVENSNSRDKYVLLSGGTCFMDKIKVTNEQLEDVVFPKIEMYNYYMNYPGFHTSYGFDFIDVDSDGRTDIVYHDTYGTDFYRCFTVDKSDESLCKFAERRHHLHFTVCNESMAVGCFVKSSSISIVGRYTGRPSVLFYENVSKTNSVWKIADWFKEGSNGNVIELTYDFLIPDGSGFYTKTSDLQQDGMRNIALPMLTLKSCGKEYLGDHYCFNTTRYQYVDAVYHKDGHGLIGFRNVVATNSLNDEIVTVNSSHYETATMGYNAMLLPSCDTTYAFYDGKKTCLETNEYRFDYVRCSLQTTVNEGRLLVVRPAMRSCKTKTFNPDSAGAIMSVKTTDYTYDYRSDNKYEHSYRCDEEQTYSGKNGNINSTNFVHKTSIRYDYEDDDHLGWVINRISKETKTMELEKKQVMTKKMKYGYSTGNPFRVETVTSVPSVLDTDPLAVETRYEYDAVGNVIKETVTAPYGKCGEKPRITTYGYDSGKRLVTSKTADPDGLKYSESYEYNLYDMIISTTSAGGLVTTCESDNPFGSTVRMTNPDGTESVEAVRWAIDSEYAPSGSRYYKWNKSTGGITTLTYYGRTGEPIRIVTKDENDDPVYVDMKYDSRGRLKRQSEPYRRGSYTKYTRYEYDDLNRITKVTAPDGTETITSYSGFTTTTSVITTDGEKHISTKTTNCLDWVVQSIDADGAEVSYSYYPDGKLESATTSGGSVKLVVKYDNAGNRVSLEDPDYGKTTSKYDAYGQLVEQVSPKGKKTLFTYDNLGRTMKRLDVAEDLETSYIYNESECKGTLAKVIHNNDTKEFSYDEFQRPVSTRETIAGVSYVTTLEYDKASRVCKKVLPSGYELNYKFFVSGRKHSVLDSHGRLLWHTDEVNSLGQLVRATTGNGAVISNTFDIETHRLQKNIVSKNIQDFSYDYDKFGNLAARKDNINNVEETFTYDDIDRLTSVTLNDRLHSEMNYDRMGRMVRKQTDGKTVFNEASFHNTKPHAMVRAVTSREVFPKEEQTIWYTSFDKVNEIKQGDNTITYTYGIDNQRVGMTEIVDGKERVKTYVGSCEFIVEDGVEKALTYLTGPYGVFAIVVEEAGEESIHYIYADHLGSWTTITDSIGNVEQRQSFDAWGNRRNAKTWSGPATDAPMFDRGFTGHEHLYAFGLINMNGRMYDPVTSSFLSPDNYVQDPTSQQGFNRYAYCFYNPLKYVDPSGERCYGPSEAEIVQRAINEARQRCWQQIYRMLEEQQLVYQQIKNGQHPFGWGSKSSSGGVRVYNSRPGNGYGGRGGRQNPLVSGSYVVDRSGYINVVADKNYMYDDGKIHFYNEDYSNSISVDYGVISSKILNEQLHWNSATENWGHTNEVTYLSMNGDIEALGVFKFMADNTDVEWSLTFVGDNDASILSTSHFENRELYQGFLYAKDWTIRQHYHSHPYSNKPSVSDRLWACDVWSRFHTAEFFLYHDGKYYKYYP